MGIADRKREHVELAVADSSQTDVSAGWDDVRLVPAALPGLDPGDIDLTTDLAGFRLAAPVVVVGMTGGFPEAELLNARLGAVAQQLGLAVGVGSQRAALTDPGLARSFAAVRDRAPDVPVIANIGACQLVDQGDQSPLSRVDLAAVVDMVRADLLAVHLNVVQELVQPEGDRHFAGLAHAIAELVEWAPVPVMVKETGAGIDRESAQRLADLGVAVLDVGGAGGTSFARIEGGRVGDDDDTRPPGYDVRRLGGARGGVGARGPRSRPPCRGHGRCAHGVGRGPRPGVGRHRRRTRSPGDHRRPRG